MLKSILIILTLSFKAHSLEIPKRLDSEDRKEVTRSLGLSTSSKILSNPYPLGGYSGLELGVGLETLDTTDLARLGCQPSEPGCPNTSRGDEEQVQYARFSVGKGLYKDIDFFLHFAPPLSQEVSDFGGILRWSFFQAKFLPINLSALAHINQLNIKDQFISENIGAQMIVGINVDNFSLYFGGGYLKSESTFLGGDTNSGTVNPNDPKLQGATNTVKEKIFSTHSLVGFSLHFDKLFAVVQVDRYRDAVISAKLGLRL